MSVKRLRGPYALLRETRDAGVNAGQMTSGVWNVRQVNTIVENDEKIVKTLSSGRFKLSPGRYWVAVTATANGIGSHRIRLQNIDTGQTEFFGTTDLTALHSQRSTIRGILRVSRQTNFEVQHRGANPDFGSGMGFAAGFSEEIYTICEFIQLARGRGQSYAKIEASSSGDNVVVGAVTGSRIRVLGGFLIASGGANTLRLKSGAAGGLMGLMQLADDGQLILPLNGFGWFETVAGEALNLELSDATLVAGALVYEEIE